ncbi:DNA polymerase domain-containing protein [Nakamurella leprariae]|uniref:ATP-dependent DNA ligase n=1 Tax=Nakamurella leprariae TaxID=2803911 RepID=A0A939BXS2_9ACTN|nr:ATP-dependent DNA ligase [Nakamurella leprariae]MBM9468848.1 ATP-dependent DNA ligase [Nakamurella leprariae]
MAGRRDAPGTSGTTVPDPDQVPLTSLDAPLFDGADVTKGGLVDYLDAVADVLLPVLRDRPLSVIRARPGQPPFMQKNTPASAPAWIVTHAQWAQASRREIRFPLCQDRSTLRWLANQRAIEYHVPLYRVDEPATAAVPDAGWPPTPDQLVLDLDPPGGAPFAAVVRAAHAVHAALDEVGLAAAVKTSGSSGVHVVVPLDGTLDAEAAAAATRALAVRTERIDPEACTTAYVLTERHGKVFIDATRSGGATVAAVYSPRGRPGLPVSFPVSWSELDGITPADFTVATAPARVAAHGGDPWAELMPAPQRIPDEVVTEGRAIPVARVQAMHEGKRRARARRAATDGSAPPGEG